MPSDLVKRLRERREAVLTQARAAAEAASDQNRAFDAAEQAAYDKAMVELEQLDTRIKQLLDTEERATQADAAFQRLGGGGGAPTARSEADRQLDRQLRAMALEHDPRPADLIPGPDRRAWSQPATELRDLLTTSGQGVPVSVYNQLLIHLVEQSAILRAGATFIQTTTGEQLKLPKSTAHSTAAIVTEGGIITESDPTLGAATFTGFKYGFLVQASFELLRDETFDVAGYLATQAAAAIAVAWGNHAINGTGTGQPRGVLLDGTAGATGPTGTSTSLGTQTTAGQGGDLLADLIASFAEPYVRSRSFGLLTRNASLNIIRKLRDGQSRYVFSLDAPAGSGASGSVFGVPIYVDPSVPAMAANAKSIIGADWSRVYVRQVGPVRFQRSDDFAFSSDLATYRALTTLDSALVDSTGALKWFANSAT